MHLNLYFNLVHLIFIKLFNDVNFLNVIQITIMTRFMSIINSRWSIYIGLALQEYDKCMSHDTSKQSICFFCRISKVNIYEANVTVTCI